MSHKDLIPANILIADGRLAGVLDTGGFGPADPALDLVVAWHALDVDARGMLREGLGCDDREWRRGAGWALVQALGLVWYYLDSNPGMAALGRSTIDRLLAAPELGV
jgi:aminoglycoside phosphotransferase (APT) family kinase protein